jgi:hypothetical protein
MSDVDDVEEIIVSQTINQIVLSDVGIQGSGSYIPNLNTIVSIRPDIPSIILTAQQI